MFQQMSENRCMVNSEPKSRGNWVSNWCYELEDMLQTRPLRNAKHCREEADVADACYAKIVETEIEIESTDGLISNLLFKAAKAVDEGDWGRAANVLAMLCGKISPHGDARERVATYFANGLVKRMAGRLHTSNKNLQHKILPQNPEDRFPAYIALTKLTPFIRFAHLTANQAILEAAETTEEIHIVDLDIMQGVQWPPLMQALAQREGCPPRLLRITGMGSTVAILNQTGARLADFANSLGIPFEFHALPGGIEALTSSLLTRTTGGALMANAIMQLPHSLEKENGSFTWPSILKALQWLSPKVVTVTEQQLGPKCQNIRQHQFFDRFSEAFRHYSAIFESLDATLPPASLERLDIEQSWLGDEIVEMVCSQDTYSMESRQQTAHWKLLMERAGFEVAPQSKFAKAQARLLLKLCYPADGYQLVEDAAGCLLLGWQDTLLCSVSSWKQREL